MMLRKMTRWAALIGLVTSGPLAQADPYLFFVEGGNSPTGGNIPVTVSVAEQFALEVWIGGLGTTPDDYLSAYNLTVVYDPENNDVAHLLPTALPGGGFPNVDINTAGFKADVTYSITTYTDISGDYTTATSVTVFAGTGSVNTVAQQDLLNTQATQWRLFTLSMQAGSVAQSTTIQIKFDPTDPDYTLDGSEVVLPNDPPNVLTPGLYQADLTVIPEPELAWVPGMMLLVGLIGYRKFLANR